MDKYTKFRDDRPMCSQVILGKPGGGGCINPVVSTPGKKCLASDEMCLFIRSGLESSMSVVGTMDFKPSVRVSFLGITRYLGDGF